MTSEYTTRVHWTEDEQPQSTALFIVTPALPDAPARAEVADDLLALTFQRVADELVTELQRQSPGIRVVGILFRGASASENEGAGA